MWEISSSEAGECGCQSADILYIIGIDNIYIISVDNDYKINEHCGAKRKALRRGQGIIVRIRSEARRSLQG